MEEIQMVLMEVDEEMKSSLAHLEKELLKIRAGKANPVMLQGIMVEYYGSQTPLNQVASVSSPDARTLAIQPFDKSAIPAIEKAIIEANLGFNPQNDGSTVRVPVPQLTGERRAQLVKKAKEEGENAKISVRSVRREKNENLKKLKNEGASEDDIKKAEDSIQAITNSFSAKIDEVLKIKETEITTI